MGFDAKSHSEDHLDFFSLALVKEDIIDDTHILR